MVIGCEVRESDCLLDTMNEGSVAASLSGGGQKDGAGVEAVGEVRLGLHGGVDIRF